MDNDVILQDPLLKVDILMWRVTKLLIKNKKQILERFSLTCSQFEILSAINYFSRIKKEIIQIDLSEKADIDPMTTSTILRNLEKKKLITRHRSPTNTRTVIVRLTSEGITLLNKAFEQIKLSSDLIYQEVNKDHLISQLLKLSDKLNKLLTV